MRVLLALTVLVALALAAAPPGPARAASPTKLVTLLRGSEYELRDAAATASVGAPIELARGESVAELRPTLLSVALGTREDAGLVEMFDVSLVRATRGRGPRLRITITSKPGLEPGTYALIVDLRRTGSRRRQRLRISIVHPPATLRAPGTVVVARRGGFPFLAERSDIRSLRLGETSKKTRLSSIKVRQVDGPTGSTIADGELVFDAVPDIAPGNQALVTPRLTGSFPRGSSSGTLEVDAPQLAGPVSVAYEVRNTMHGGWLVLAILGGVFVGFLVRQVLAQVITLEAARQRGFQLLDDIATEAVRRRDRDFLTGLDGVRGTLENTLRDERAATAIDTKVDTSRIALQKLVEELEKERTTVRALLSALAGTATRQWSAPPEVLRVLTAQQARIDDAAQSLAVYDVGGAREKLTAVEQAIEAALRENVPTRFTQVRNLLARLEEAKLPSTLRTETKAAQAEIDAAIGATGIEAPELVPDVVLHGVHVVETRLRRMLLETLPRLLRVSDDVLGELSGRVGAPQAESIAAARRALTGALQAAAAGSADLERVGERADALLDALRAAVIAVIPEREAGARSAAATRMDSGRYVEAARAAAAASKPPDRRLDVPAGPAARGLVSEDDAAPAPMPAVAPPALLQIGATVRDSAFDVVRNRGTSVAVSLLAKVLRTLLLAIGITLVGCAVFLPTFSGTFEQLVAAFLWGFAADVTSQGLYELAKSSGTPAAQKPAPPAAA